MQQQSFIGSIFRTDRNRQYLFIALVGTILQFLIFKSLYPFADFFSDSYSYIYGASANLAINIWPIGYSRFLLAFHEFTHSDTALVGFQYFFLELCCLYFFYTLLYFYSPGRLTRNIIFGFLFFNPTSLYICNYVNSDPLFAALSLWWITELLWIMNRPAPYQVALQAILLFFCFTVRNNAYYYPAIATLAFILSRHSLITKFTGISLPLIFIGIFIIHTRNAAEELTGTKQFSLFTGWQLANNALYMRGHVQVDSTKLPSKESADLDRLSRKFFFHDVPGYFDDYLSVYGANFFIRDGRAPLKKYFNTHYDSKTEQGEVEDWGKAAIPFGEYGFWLIRKHPLSYTRYFMLLNTRNYFLPPLEKLEEYNLSEDEVGNAVQDWFDYKTPTVTAVSKTAQASILAPIPYFFFFLNVLIAGSVLWLFLKRKNVSIDRQHRNAFLLLGALLLANFCFCVFATIIVMRYQFFPMMLTLALPLMLIEQLERKKEKAAAPELSKSLNLSI